MITRGSTYDNRANTAANSVEQKIAPQTTGIFSNVGDEAEGVLFRVVLSAESVATTVDRKAIEAAMGESSLARFLKFGKPSRSFNCYARTSKAKRAA